MARTLNSWIIFIDEMRLDQLDRKAGLADTTAADYYQLVFSCELQRHRETLAKPNSPLRCTLLQLPIESIGRQVGM